MVKSPWDPEGFKVKEVKGSKVTLQRGEETKTRAKNNVKLVKKRPKELDTPDQLLDPTDYALDDDALEDAPEYQHLPASRSWDRDEIDALRMDWSRPPRCNLVCIHHFCPDLAGEDEPDKMEEIRLERD